MCEGCGQPTGSRSRWCAGCRRERDRLRKRAARGQVVEFPVPSDAGAVAAATLHALRAAGREDTPLGQAALVLAHRLDNSSGDTGSSQAAVARELRVTLEEALRGAPREADAVDGLRAKVVRLRA